MAAHTDAAAKIRDMMLRGRACSAISTLETKLILGDRAKDISKMGKGELVVGYYVNHIRLPPGIIVLLYH